MSESKPSVVDGIIYIFLGLLAVALGVMGVLFILDPGNATRPFLMDETGTLVTKHQIAYLMMPAGFLGGIALGVYGVMRMKGKPLSAPARNDEEDEDDEDDEDDAEASKGAKA